MAKSVNDTDYKRHSKKRTLMWSSYIYWKKVYMSACDYSGGKVSNTSCGN